MQQHANRSKHSFPKRAFSKRTLLALAMLTAFAGSVQAQVPSKVQSKHDAIEKAEMAAAEARAARQDAQTAQAAAQAAAATRDEGAS